MNCLYDTFTDLKKLTAPDPIGIGQLQGAYLSIKICYGDAVNR